MRKNKLLVLSAIALGTMALSGCNNATDPNNSQGGGETKYNYTYNTYLASNPKTWNVHNWETSDDSYVIGFTEMGLYDLGFNETKTGFAFINEMASGEPIDVSGELTPEEKKQYYGRSSVNLTSGVAYDIPLNPDAKWEDGTPINADTYVESMKRLLDPKLINHRADSFYKGTISLVNAEGYFKQGNESIEAAYPFVTKNSEMTIEDPNFQSDGRWYINLGGYTPYAGQVFSGIEDSSSNFYTVLNRRGRRISDDVENAAARITDAVGKTLIRIQRDENKNSDWADVEKVDDIKEDKDGTNMWDYAIADEQFYDHPLTVVGGEKADLPEIEDYDWDDLQEDIKTFVTGVGAPSSFARKEGAWKLPLFGTYYNDTVVEWDKVGIKKVDDYKIRLIMKETNRVSTTDLKFSLTGNWIVKTDLYDKLRGPVSGSNLEATKYGSGGAENYMSYGPYKLSVFQSNKYIEIVKNEQWYGWTDGKHEGQFQTERFVTQIITDHKTAMLQFETGKIDDIELDADDMKKYGNSSRVQHTPTSYTQKLSFNVSWDALKQRQEQAPADHKGNKTIFTNKNFRKAVSLSIDRKNFASQCTAGSSGFTGLLNDLYISDVESGEYYRNTAQGLNVYPSVYAHLGGETIDEENGKALPENAIGYNQALAVEYLKKALSEEKASEKAGHYTEGDKIAINLKVYNQESATTIASYNFLKTALDTIGAKAGVEFDFWMEQDEDYYNNAKKGAYDTIFSTWGGAQMNPWGLMEVYCDSEFDSNCEYGMTEQVKTLTATFDSDGDGTEETKTISGWYNWLNESVEEDRSNYDTDEEFEVAFKKMHNQRLNVLSNLEIAYLNTFSTLPVLSRASSSITSYKVEFGSEKYIPLIGYGGVRYMTYEYTDAEWQAAIDSGEINADLYRQ